MAVKKKTKKVTKKATKKNTKKVTKKVTKKALKKPSKGKLAKKVMGKKPVKTKTKAKNKPSVKGASNRSLTIGAQVPEFSVPATGGKEVRLSDLKGKKVVLYFYPKDMTPGCTIEGREFTQLKNEFDSIGAVVFGVSRDSVESHEKFKEKECYTIDLLSDEKEELCELFDVIKNKNMYGKIVRGIERSTFVINEEGKLQQEWRGVKAEAHAAQVLEYLKN
jgi:peroxiredoxin Q/BCP